MHHRHDSLSPEKLQLFAAGLSGLSPDEVRRTKVLYLRNAIDVWKDDLGGERFELGDGEFIA